MKNRYIARTFIMPGQALRQKKIRLKLNTVRSEFKDKVVLLVDDSIVRGTTSMELVQMARDAGARKVYFASAAPPVRYPNVYGIDIPTRSELVANDRNEPEIALAIGADLVIYNDLADLEDAIRCLNPGLLKGFDTSCFSGEYVTPEVTPQYISAIEENRGSGRSGAKRPLEVLTVSADVVDRDEVAEIVQRRKMQNNSPCEVLHNNQLPRKSLSITNI